MSKFSLFLFFHKKEFRTTEKRTKFLQKKELVPFWRKAKKHILMGEYGLADLKKRMPYKSGKYYFRITRQYRAIGFIEGNILKIFEIDDHQS